MGLLSIFRRRSPLRIETYRSYGPPSEVRFAGRVLANRLVAAATEEEDRHRSIVRMARRFLTREVADAAVRVTNGVESTTVVTSGEGYFEARLGVDGGPGDWVVAQCAVADAEAPDSSSPIAAHSVLLDERIERLVISDVDDTVLQNAAGDTWGTVWATLTGSAVSRSPVVGAPELYRSLAAAPSAVAYVSSSPWNLHGFLTAFLERNDFPLGPLILRDFGINRATLGSSSHGTHKAQAIASLLAVCSQASVVLIGDTSQQDPDAFATIAEEHLEQVAAVILRDVGDPERTALALERGAGVRRAGTVFDVVSTFDSVAAILRDRTDWFD